MSKFAITNFVLFQLAWFACALLTPIASWLLVFIIALHLLLSDSLSKELALLPLGLIGVLFDLSMFYGGVITFSHDIFPIWLVLLWGIFALSLAHSFAWLAKMNKYLVALIGAVFGPLSYFAAFKFGAIIVTVDVIPFSIYYGIGWFFMLPAMIFLAHKPYKALMKLY